MLVKTIAHGRLVAAHLQKAWKQSGKRYLAIDTETKARTPYPGDDALTIGRSRIVVWSICYQGASYSFPTSEFKPFYPTMGEWADHFLWPLFVDPKLTLVAHNWNYDANVFWFHAELPVPCRIWDTMIGCWAAAEYQPKGLKERAPILGRFLRETKTVDFTDEDELTEYAEQDVVVAEELYNTQVYGKIERPKIIRSVAANGVIIPRSNPFHRKPFTPEKQGLSLFRQAWVKYMELPVLRATMRAERHGFPFDLKELSAIRTKVVRAKKASLSAIFRLAGTRFNPNSGRDLAKVVDQLNVVYEFRTKKGAPSFTAENLGKMEDTHPFFKKLSEYKRLEKLTSVYIGTERCNNGYSNDCGLERWINPDTGAVHATAGTIEAVTGRGSSSRPNLQQIPVRKDQFGVRKVFSSQPRGQILAPRYVLRRRLIVLDYGQLELRIMALLSKDVAMTKILCDPAGDIHSHTADQFGVSRDAAKNLNFLLLYGGQEHLLARELTRFGVATDISTAQQYKLKHWEVYPRVKAQREEWCKEHRVRGHIRLFLGRTRTLPDADWSNDYTTHRAETRLANNAVQGTGQDMLKAAIIRSDPCCINPDSEFPKRVSVGPLHRKYLADRAKVLEKLRRTLRAAECRFILQVHDELIFTSIPSAAEECVAILADIMTWRHFFPGMSTYNVPLVAEGGVGDNWHAAKSKEAEFHVRAGFEHFAKFG